MRAEEVCCEPAVVPKPNSMTDRHVSNSRCATEVVQRFRLVERLRIQPCTEQVVEPRSLAVGKKPCHRHD